MSSYMSWEFLLAVSQDAKEAHDKLNWSDGRWLNVNVLNEQGEGSTKLACR